MPARGDRTAPSFDKSNPRELRRYFAELDRHFTRASVQDDTAKKEHSCRYLDVDTAELWETLPEYKDPLKSFDEFKKKVLELYPGSGKERTWSVADLDLLVGERSRLGIQTLGDLGDFYRQFLAITTYLLDQKLLSEVEQVRAFRRAFQQSLDVQVAARLQLKHPDHYPSHPYQLNDILEAARWVLHDTPSTLSTGISPAALPLTTASSVPSSGIKAEDFQSIMTAMTPGHATTLSAQGSQVQNSGGPRLTDGAPQRRTGGTPNNLCSFCWVPGEHFIATCPKVDEYLKAGKVIRRVVDNKIVLPSGAFVPGHILPGRPLRERVDGWHRLNPGQLASVGTVSQAIVATNRDPPLSREGRIQSLERELFALRSGRKYQPAPTLVRVQDQAAAMSGVAKKPAPNYQTVSPVYSEKDAQAVFDRAMAQNITVSQKELLSLAPELRNLVREVCSARRQAVETNQATPETVLGLHQATQPVPHQPGTPLPGSLVIPDVYETYLKSLPPGATLDTLVVSQESAALRAINPLVDHQLHVECILDPGSQIIAMSDAVCNELALIYDPSFRLNMQSANGELNLSLGLARNVPFLIGDLTLYLQVHVLRKPAYDILLGRPFDVLTESIVKNFRDETQSITIHDPNTGKVAVVPTVPRGHARFVHRPVVANTNPPPEAMLAGFRTSRN
ncbi:uncharacterized protein STEHIDRAFT_61979 [Stereum hirsutum FP-91666 SS1]|uniref:uncharacterized protein n=1 Tax=Stereum hirsutum (strain FP-91666) TaxID=721885 RepID=UPI000444A02E|nr:uncharacterized protein STEHIDRAFT_61979 [Stereum hirsutum FP-91666 SS1]EIM84042.1 hypothetical protein STEHIDRAFT_61979 [Stereum hirsutum FP-91666 SS1]